MIIFVTLACVMGVISVLQLLTAYFGKKSILANNLCIALNAIFAGGGGLYGLFGLIGGAFKRVYGVRKHIVVVIAAVVMTALFTVADNIITPVMYGFTLNAAKAYWIASVYTAVPQMLCSLVTSLLLFPPLLKFMQTSKF